SSSTTPQDFLNHYIPAFLKLGLKGYPIETFDVLFVKALSGDKQNTNLVKAEATISQKRSYSTKARSTNVSIPSSDAKVFDEKLLALGVDSINDDVYIKDARRNILPLKLKAKQMKKVGVIDIETFVHNGKLYPYAIGIKYTKYNKLRTSIIYYEDK